MNRIMPQNNHRLKHGVGIPNLRWYVAALLFTATVIAYVDLQSLSVVAPVLNKDLNLTNTQYSNILEAYLIATTCMYVIAGMLIDRLGNRITVAVFVAWWSIATACHGLARNALQLGTTRFLFGLGQAGIWMADEKAVSEWYPRQERAFTAGIVINAGASMGAIVAPPLIAWITFRFGWRAAFIAAGCLGLLWIPAWLLTYYTPENHPRITPEEYGHIKEFSSQNSAALSADESATGAIRWIDLLRVRQTWALFLGRVFSDPVWWFYLFWLPKYLRERRGFSLMEIGIIAWLPYLSAGIGSVLGGLFSGYLIKKSFSVLNSRKIAMLGVVVLMPLGMLIAFTHSSVIAVALVCLVTFCHMAWKTNLVTLTNDIYPTRIVATAGAIVGMGTGLGGVLSTHFVGEIIDKFSYTPVFVVFGLFHVVALLIVHTLVKRPLSEAKPTVLQEVS
jgi:ACS family hexuronate transporter-like MFS transporter